MITQRALGLALRQLIFYSSRYSTGRVGNLAMPCQRYLCDPISTSLVACALSWQSVHAPYCSVATRFGLQQLPVLDGLAIAADSQRLDHGRRTDEILCLLVGSKSKKMCREGGGGMAAQYRLKNTWQQLIATSYRAVGLAIRRGLLGCYFAMVCGLFVPISHTQLHAKHHD